MTQPSIHLVIRALAEDGRSGALGIATHAVDMFASAVPAGADRALTLDILLRDLATLRGVAPHLAGFFARIETHVGAMRIECLRDAAARPAPADIDASDDSAETVATVPARRAA